MNKQSKIFVMMLLCCCYTLQAQKYQPDWKSLSTHTKIPKWFKDAKFGIYFHWGVYSVPGFGNEWYPRNMHFQNDKVHKYHEENYGPTNKFGYHHFIPLFKAEYFNAEEWAQLFKKAGAKFAGPVAEHHDGFAMWDSECTPWNAKDMGPKRDIVGEIERAVKKEGMKFITTFHHARNLQRYSSPEILKNELSKDMKGKETKRFYNSHYPFFSGTFPTSDDSKLKYLYGNIPEQQWLENIWLGKLKEVIDNYDPDLIWFDSWLNCIPDSYQQKFCAYYFNKADERNKEVCVVRKQKDMPASVSIENLEKTRKSDLQPEAWETDQTISTGSWCYTHNMKIKPSRNLIHELIDIVSKNGVLLLNISPKANGIIPDDQRKTLLEIGNWLEKYGEAIYDTRPWYTYGEGPTKEPNDSSLENHRKFYNLKYTSGDFRFTTKGNHIYILTLGKLVAGNIITLKSFAASTIPNGKKVKKVSMLNSDKKVDWAMETTGLKLSVPEVPNETAVVYKVEME